MGANKSYRKTQFSVKTGNTLVSIVSDAVLARLKLKPMEHYVEYGEGFSEGKFSLVRFLSAICP